MVPINKRTMFLSKHKYGMSANGSKLEKAVGQHLHLLEKAGELRNIEEQNRVQICCRDPNCPSKQRINSVVDFTAWDIKHDRQIWIEAKGFETPEWRLKRRLWLHSGPGPLQVYAGSYSRFHLKETIGAHEER